MEAPASHNGHNYIQYVLKKQKTKNHEQKLLFKHSGSKIQGHIFQETRTLPRPLAFKEHKLRILFCLQSHHKITRVTKSAKCLICTRHCAKQFHIHCLIYSDYFFLDDEKSITALLIRRNQLYKGMGKQEFVQQREERLRLFTEFQQSGTSHS